MSDPAKEPKKTISKQEGVARMKRMDSAPTPDDLKNAKVPTRRVRMLMVNPTDFMFLFKKGMVFAKGYKIIDGVPEDAKIIAVAPDSIRNGIMLVVESSTYEEIPINVLPPVQPVSIDLLVKNGTKKKKVPRKKK